MKRRRPGASKPTVPTEPELYEAAEGVRLRRLSGETPCWVAARDWLVEALLVELGYGVEDLERLRTHDITSFNVLWSVSDDFIHRLVEGGIVVQGVDEVVGPIVSFTSAGLITPITLGEDPSKSPQSSEGSELILKILDDGKGLLVWGDQSTPDPEHRVRGARKPLRPKVASLARYLLECFREDPNRKIPWEELYKVADMTTSNSRRSAGRLIAEFNQHLTALEILPLIYQNLPDVALPPNFPSIGTIIGPPQ
ncbi:MAG: hypothetical protein O7H41_02970 [Planctomycetota bacterium]|nr:hypothetical protein [Planctomycetota bacterium]